MRVVVEISNGSLAEIYAEGACDVLVINRDDLSEEMLPDGDAGYASVWDASIDPEGVAEAFRLAGFQES